MAVAPAPPDTGQALPAQRRVDWPGLLKDAVIAALVAGLLGLPFIGLEDLRCRRRRARRAHAFRPAGDRRRCWCSPAVSRCSCSERGAIPACRGAAGRWRGSPFGAAATPSRSPLLGVAVAVALPFLPFSSRYLVDLGTTVLIYVMLGWGLNIVVGLAGLLDLGYVAFYAVGAYTFALLARDFGFGFWEALPLSGVMAARFRHPARVSGIAAARRLSRDRHARLWRDRPPRAAELVHDDRRAERPVGAAADVFSACRLRASAPDGGMTFADLFGIEFSPDHRVIFLYYLILVLALITNFFTLRIRRLPVGRAWEALREDEIACRALGINPTNVKLSAFAIGAMFGGFAGCFFATRQGFISPESFTFIESATILAIVVLGGMGSQLGVVLAALVLVTLPEFGRAFAEFRMLVFGAAMVAIMVWRPRGLLSLSRAVAAAASAAAAGAAR